MELSTLIEDEFGIPCIEFVDDSHCWAGLEGRGILHGEDREGISAKYLLYG